MDLVVQNSDFKFAWGIKNYFSQVFSIFQLCIERNRIPKFPGFSKSFDIYKVSVQVFMILGLKKNYELIS